MKDDLQVKDEKQRDSKRNCTLTRNVDSLNNGKPMRWLGLV